MSLRPMHSGRIPHYNIKPFTHPREKTYMTILVKVCNSSKLENASLISVNLSMVCTFASALDPWIDLSASYTSFGDTIR